MTGPEQHKLYMPKKGHLFEKFCTLTERLIQLRNTFEILLLTYNARRGLALSRLGGHMPEFIFTFEHFRAPCNLIKWSDVHCSHRCPERVHLCPFIGFTKNWVGFKMARMSLFKLFSLIKNACHLKHSNLFLIHIKYISFSFDWVAVVLNLENSLSLIGSCRYPYCRGWHVSSYVGSVEIQQDV